MVIRHEITRGRKIFAYYFPVDGPWPSAESKKIFQAAIDTYTNLVKQDYDYVVLISSSHWASQGYWVELTPVKLSNLDTVIFEHKVKT